MLIVSFALTAVRSLSNKHVLVVDVDVRRLRSDPSARTDAVAARQTRRQPLEDSADSGAIDPD